MPTIFQPPRAFIPNASGVKYAGAKAYFYITGTTTPKDTYTDFALTTPSANPVVADSNGDWATIYLQNDGRYRVTLKTSADVLIYTQDDVGGPVLTRGEWGQIGIPQTAQESAAGVTPTNYYYEPGNVHRYGAVGDGTTDDSAAFASAALVCGTHALLIPCTASGYLINTPVVLPANATVLGQGSPLLKTSVNGNHIMSATSVATVTVDGVRFQGSSSSTTPSSGFGGYSVANTGLLTVTKCTDVRITNCEATTFYNGLTAQECTRLWMTANKVTHWTFCGILASRSSQFMIDNNDVVGCDQAGAVVAYGIQATGDQNGGTTQQRNIISGNRIADIQSWDGIMSHDCDGLQVVNNDIRNVRNGIDITHLASTNYISNVIVSGNYIEATTTDSWSGAAGSHRAISIGGYDATHRIARVAVTGNIIYGFYNISGMAAAGLIAVVAVSHADSVNLTGNIINGNGSIVNSAGYYASGTCNGGLLFNGNIANGYFQRAALRLEGVTADSVAFVNNCTSQSDTSYASITITGSTLTQVAIGTNPTNSTIPFTYSTSTLSFSGYEASRSRVTVTYSASMTINAALGNQFDITATDGNAFTIQPPSNPSDGQRITITIRNAAGAPLGAATFDTVFKMSAWTNPANGYSRSIDFRYNGTNWVQMCQTGTDVPN